MFLAGVAHPVERHLAKVEVASSSLVTRSIKKKDHTNVWSFFFTSQGDEARRYKCDCPVDSRWFPARREPHLNVSSLVTRSTYSTK